jgi:hypothetical protein
MYRIIVSCLFVIFSVGSYALTEQELRALLDTGYNSGPAAAAAKRFSEHYKIPPIQAQRLVILHRTKNRNLRAVMAQVLELINGKEESPIDQKTPQPPSTSSPPEETPSFGASSSGEHHGSESADSTADHSEPISAAQAERALREKAQRAEEEARLRAVERSKAEADQERKARKEEEDRRRKEEEIGHWLQHTPLIGESRAAVGGFEKIKDRLDVFNPLYGASFKAHGVPPHQRKVFPNVPIVHQYDPQASSGGGYFPLIVKFPSLFLPLLPQNIQAHFKPVPDCELYWAVQLIGSFSGTGRGVKDNIVFRPQYWVQPNGAPVAFKADVHLLDPEGHYLHLPPTGYSIHDGVASPNAPVIPFQGLLKSGETVSFWSLTKYGKRTAITYHWILNDADMIPLGRSIEQSATIQELAINLRKNRALFSNHRVIDEIEFILGR